MSGSLTVYAPAKLNLTLDVLGRRPDGYHDLKMVMQTVTLFDTVTLCDGTGPGIRVRSNLPYLPSNGMNLAVKAADAFFREVGIKNPSLDITLKKEIPVCAGTAGGSSDAAAVLRGLNRLYGTGLTPEALTRLGESVGSDVPYCVVGGTVLAEGRGERLTPLPPLPECTLVLCKPAFSISTPELFRTIDQVRLRHHPDTAGMLAALEHGDLRGISMRMYNVFEDVLPPGRSEVIQTIRDRLLDGGALGTCMSGTGPTVFGLFQDPEKAARTAEELKKTYQDTFVTRPQQHEET